MPRPLTLTIKETALSKRKKLVITPESVEFKNKSLAKGDIDEIRYGVKFIRGFEFYIGRIYCIDIKSLSGVVMKIRFTSLYGIRKKRLDRKYSMIVDSLWDNHMREVAESFITLFKNDITFELLGVIFSREGILLTKQSPLILWEDVGTKDYYRYYAIFSKTNPHNYRGFYYRDDWNTGILYSVSKYILGVKNLA